MPGDYLEGPHQQSGSGGAGVPSPKQQCPGEQLSRGEGHCREGMASLSPVPPGKYFILKLLS